VLLGNTEGKEVVVFIGQRVLVNWIGIAESGYDVLFMIGNRPLNPPILGDFLLIVPPKVGGLGGQNIPQISNIIGFITIHS
jgi:hypothetical protein